VLTLDAGGTNFRFSATRGNCPSLETIVRPTCAHELAECLESIVQGLRAAREDAPSPPVAISFGFPGPADYPNGVIGDLQHLPAFRGGVPLATLLEDQFGLPVFINNDGDLFAYGEALAGFLPYINRLLEKGGSSKRYRNLVGMTLGSGLGGGIVRDGQLFLGDNSLGAEVWLLRNKLSPKICAEDGANIDGVRRVYAEHAGVAFEDAPDPKIIFEIGRGQHLGDKAAALEAFHQFGEVVGDALANLLTVVDGLAVIGGGLADAWPLFSAALMSELNGDFIRACGTKQRRLVQEVFDLENENERRRFLQNETKEVSAAAGSYRTTRYDSSPRIGIGRSRLGTSEAIAIGAYCYALEQLDRAASSAN
jgi:glucokinase